MKPVGEYKNIKVCISNEWDKISIASYDRLKKQFLCTDRFFQLSQIAQEYILEQMISFQEYRSEIRADKIAYNLLYQKYGNEFHIVLINEIFPILMNKNIHRVELLQNKIKPQ